ncbi:MAG: SPASM domain-containing protein [Candidatus Omnitrophica bacterium]|nr:SPASM domain-containing protein [Candidatus Omnitrophota bacterium]
MENNQVYQFRMWEKNFAVDIASGNFFEVDKAASDIINLLHKYPASDVKNKLSKKYGSQPVSRAMGNLNKLIKNKMLFSAEGQKEKNIKRRITDLTLNIVNKCNLGCRYCWNLGGSYGSSSSNNKKMDCRVAYKAVDLLLKESRGFNDLVVDFYGGEPLLNFDLMEKTIGYCNKIRARKGINFRFLLATNGTLLNKKRGDFLIGSGVDVAVSLDGPKKIQDMQRPFLDGRGSFDTVMDNIKSLKEDYRKRIVGRATFTPYSTDVVKTFSFLRSLGFDRIEVCESEKAGYGLESKNRFFFSGEKGINRLKSLYNKLAAFYTREVIKGNLNYENTYFNRFFKQLSRLYHIQSIVGTCSAGYSLMAVDMDGSIYPCTAFVGIQRFKIGTVDNGINDNKLQKFLDTKIYGSDACNKCWAKRICKGCGSCYNLNYFTNKNLGQPDNYYCELFRYKTKLMIAMISEIARDNPHALERVLVPQYYITRGKKKQNAN